MSRKYMFCDTAVNKLSYHYRHRHHHTVQPRSQGFSLEGGRGKGKKGKALGTRLITVVIITITDYHRHHPKQYYVICVTNSRAKPGKSHSRNISYRKPLET